MSQVVQISLLAKNEIAREGLRQILSGGSFAIAASVSDVSGLLDSQGNIEDDTADHVIVVDGGTGNSGLDACRKLAARRTQARLALLLDQYSFEEVVEAFQIGADGVIIKEISCAPLTESIRLIAMGEKVFPSQLVTNLTSWMPATAAGDWKSSAASVGLSDREIEILESIMAGMANKVIARQFGICEATVKVHVKAILRKLGVENRTQAATWGVKNGLGEPVQLNLREVKPMRILPKLMPISGRAA
jgi:two-component system, NarL family, nitrate/nitrite response regulator NarL